MAYDDPGKMGELTGDLLDRWRDSVSRLFDNGVQVAHNEAMGTHAEVYFFNPLRETNVPLEDVDIAWTAFPRRLSQAFPDPRDGWRFSDSRRDAQEEYCEWTVVRDPNDLTKIIRIVFTTETPDYFEFLAWNDRNLLVDIYRRHVSSDVEFNDLVSGDRYNPLNKWNHPGQHGMGGTILHMGGNGANTLGAAVTLTAEATWPSVDGAGNLITAEQALIACRRFGDPARHSDPFIGAQVNQLVRLGKRVSLASPAGLYIHGIDLSEFEVPSGYDPADLLTIERGTEDFMMRVAFEAPEGAGFFLSDVRVGDELIQFGGQIAEKLRIRVRGVAAPSEHAAPSIPCDGAFPSLEPFAQSRRSMNPPSS